MTETIIFLGPSLPLKAAQAIYPYASYHEPLRCGDIIKALRLKPHTIVIIDGLFEQTASVWHKEILLALSLGVRVIGASSMGALRAAEMHTLGMMGHGQVFEWYRDNVIIDDDEVALVHAADSYESTITPMVNVRATLQRAALEGVITAHEAQQLLATLKATPYFNRSLPNAVSHYPALQRWLPNNMVDQKRLDAISLLQQLAAFPERPMQDDEREPAMVTSVFMNKIFREMIVAPFSKPHRWLPLEERRYAEAQTKPWFANLQRIGKLLHTLHDIIRASAIELPEAKSYPQQLLAWAKRQRPQIPRAQLLRSLLLFSNLEPEGATPDDAMLRYQEIDAEGAQILNTLATLYNALLSILKQRRVRITMAKGGEFALLFRRERQLIDRRITLDWVEKHHLRNEDGFREFLLDVLYLHYFIDQHQTGLLGIETDLTVTPWGIAALELCEANHLTLCS